MTLAISHRDGDQHVLDLVREVRPPFNPDSVVEESCQLVRPYRLSSLYGDRYGAGWVLERFQHHGITYLPAEKTKSDIYKELLPLLNNSRYCELLDNQRLVVQLLSLERRTGRGTGRDSIDHPPNAYDDIANAVAGALTLPSLNYLEAWGRW